MPKIPAAWQRNLGYLEPEEQELLGRAKVAVLGLGGVGGVAAELLVRAGVGRLAICDGDVFDASNLNRQVGALTSTLGQDKTRVAAQRLRDVNPDLELSLHGPLGARGRTAAAMLAQAACGVLAVDALVPSLAAHRAARSSGVALVEALALPVVQVRVFDPRGPDPEQGLPSQGRDLDRVDGRELARAYARQEAGRLGDGDGGPLALPAGFALAMSRGRAAPSLGPLAWLAGSLAALEVLKLLTGRGRRAASPGASLDPCAWRLHLASWGSQADTQKSTPTAGPGDPASRG